MKKITYTLLAAIIALLALSCTEENPVLPQPEDGSLEFIADFNDVEVRTSLAQGKKVLWNQKDQISVFNGKKSAPFQISELSPDALSAHFTGKLQKAERYWAIYPQQPDLLWTAGKVSAELPTVQTIMPASFDENAALAVAEVENKSLHFKNVGALLSLSINQEGITSIRITSANAVALSGPAEITVAATPSVKAGSAAVPYVELQGDFVKGQTYYAVVYPGFQADGFELTFKDKFHRTATVANTTPIDIRRNAVVKLLDQFTVPAEKWNGPGEDIPGVQSITVADFMKAPVNKSKWYKLTGIVRNITSTTYGNFDLVDESGSVYVYGLTKTKTNGKNDKSFSQTGVKEGDLLTLVGTRSNYNGQDEVGGPAYYICHSTPTPDPTPDPDPNPDPNPDPDPTPQPDPTPGDGTPANGQTKWMEMPGGSSQDGKIGTYYAGQDRNYTYNYQYSTYTSLWVAYPLYSSTIGGSRSGSWKSAPGIPEKDQINIWESSYGVNIGNTIYARGHQIPDADRSGRSDMQSQTYYAINSTPQIQDGFNGGIWMHLESGVRKALRNKDTIYVVTGATFQKVGGNENIKKIKPKNDSKMCPVPNYYWKVLLKVKRNGDTCTDARAIGFWLPHQVLSGDYAVYATSVDEIEKFTGFDFFVNLPENLQTKAEAEKNWSGFNNF